MREIGTFRVFVFMVAAVCAGAAAGQRVESVFMTSGIDVPSYPPAPQLLRKMPIAAAADLPTAEVAEPERVNAVVGWNERGGVPMRAGIIRLLPRPIEVSMGGAAAAGKLAATAHGVTAILQDGRVAWSTKLHVEGAAALQVRLERLQLQPGTSFYVYGEGEVPAGFDADHRDSAGGVWSPSVTGETIYLDVLSSGAASFAMTAVADHFSDELLGLVPRANAGECLVDATCIGTAAAPDIDFLRRAIAHTRIPRPNNFIDICSGGMINTRTGGSKLFLTANHCLSDQDDATNIELWWDWKTTSCNGTSVGAITKTKGATLLATGTDSDYTLLQLNTVPANRAALGWDADPNTVRSGMMLYRVSHPAPESIRPQSYSTSIVTATGVSCQDRPRSRYIYSVHAVGTTFGGSSGSPVVVSPGAYVVGQLFGACRPQGATECDASSLTLDGAFSTTFGHITSFLDGSGTNPITPQTCAPTATRACLAGNRFGVEVAFKTPDGTPGTGNAIKYTSNSALFWFFGADNIEMVVKVLDACPSRFWVFGASATSLEYTITVTDSHTGKVKTYSHAPNTPTVAITDTNAFDTCGQ